MAVATVHQPNMALLPVMKSITIIKKVMKATKHQLHTQKVTRHQLQKTTILPKVMKVLSMQLPKPNNLQRKRLIINQ